jgi:hypothetical protein
MTRDTEDTTPLPPNHTMPQEPPGKFHSDEMHTFHANADPRETPQSTFTDPTLKIHQIIMLSAATIYAGYRGSTESLQKDYLMKMAIRDAVLLWKKVQKEQDLAGAKS